jgi:hypothetical protein
MGGTIMQPGAIARAPLTTDGAPTGLRSGRADRLSVLPSDAAVTSQSVTIDRQAPPPSSPPPPVVP